MNNNVNNTGQKGTASFTPHSAIGTFDETVDYRIHGYVGKTLSDPTSNTQEDIIVELQKNVMIFGGTGSAKTTAILEPNMIVRGTSFFAVVPKASSFLRTASYYRAMGYDIYVLAPFLTQLSSTYNPLLGLTADDPQLADKIDLITSALILVSITDQYWGNAARRLVAGVIAYLIETPGEEVSLGRVMDILSCGIGVISQIAEKVIKDTKTYKPNSLARRKLARYAELTSDNREAQGILSTALTELNVLDSPTVCAFLSTSEFDPECLLDPDRKVAVFFILPPEKLEPCNKLTRLVISMVINTISSIGGDPDNPIDLYIDEAGTIGYLPILSQGVALMRERGIRFWTVFQSLSQLQRDYPMDWKNFIGNSNPIFLLDVMDADEAEYFSKMLGETTLERKNGQEYSQSVGDLPYMLQNRLDALHNGLRGNEQISGTAPRPLMTPDELRRLPEDLGIVITDGHPAIFVKAKSYEAEPFCQVVWNDRKK